MSTDKTTVLPDGSAFFTATIMSKEEAMKLPIEKRPICYRISGELYTAVFEAIGAASMCWNPPPSQVFASEKASDIAVKLCFKIAEELENRELVTNTPALPATVVIPETKNQKYYVVVAQADIGYTLKIGCKPSLPALFSLEEAIEECRVNQQKGLVASYIPVV